MNTKDIKKKIIDLDMRYSVGIRREELPIIVDKIQAIASSAQGESSWLKAMQDIVHDARMDVLRLEANKNLTSESRKCLVCNEAAEPITLMGGRKAFYCATHRVVLPDEHISDD